VPALDRARLNRGQHYILRYRIVVATAVGWHPGWKGIVPVAPKVVGLHLVCIGPHAPGGEVAEEFCAGARVGAGHVTAGCRPCWAGGGDWSAAGERSVRYRDGGGNGSLATGSLRRARRPMDIDKS
jgi:hypothetical protein